MSRLQLIPTSLVVIGLAFFGCARLGSAEIEEADLTVVRYEVEHTASTSQPACCPEYRLTYCHHPTLLPTCCGHCVPIETVLEVADPCDPRCILQIPVQLPGCCTGQPLVVGRCGILVRGVVMYRWCCGYMIRVVFTHCGEVVVHSYGRS